MKFLSFADSSTFSSLMSAIRLNKTCSSSRLLPLLSCSPFLFSLNCFRHSSSCTNTIVIMESNDRPESAVLFVNLCMYLSLVSLNFLNSLGLFFISTTSRTPGVFEYEIPDFLCPSSTLYESISMSDAYSSALLKIKSCRDIWNSVSECLPSFNLAGSSKIIFLESFDCMNPSFA